MFTKSLGLIILTLTFSLAAGETAQANHWYGQGGYGYNTGYQSYGYGGAYGFGGYANRTSHYHYTNPRVTTGYGFRSVPSYNGFGYNRQSINIQTYRGGFYGGFGGGRSFGNGRRFGGYGY